MKTKSFVLFLLCAGAPFMHSTAQQVTLEKIWTSDTTLRTPESVYFHAASNTLFVTNIDGQPWAKDGKGFISLMTPGGRITLLKWIEGLNSPKGIAITGNTMYVADMDELLVIDIKQAAIMQRIKPEGAENLNDVTADPQGNVYISDSKMKKVYRYSNGKASLFIESLGGPNGLLWQPDGLLVLDKGELKQLQADNSLKPLAPVTGGVDGIERVKDNEFVVSCWQGEVFYVDTKAGTSTKLLDTQAQKLQTADIGYDPKNRIVFIPTFFGNTVTAWRLKAAK